MKLVAILRLVPDADPARVRDLMEAQLLATWALHTDAAVRSIEQLADRPGAMIAFECDSAEQVHAHLATLPLLRAGLLTTEVIAVRPYDGWRRLFRPEPSLDAGDAPRPAGSDSSDRSAAAAAPAERA